MLNKIKSWFIRDDASTAVEFALVGLPFITILMGIIEISLFFASGVSLEGATNEASRLIKTGQVQGAADPLTAFQTALCNGVNGMLSCDGLQYEVTPIPSNSFINEEAMTPKFDKFGNLIVPPFDAGGSGQTVLVRVVYRYTFLMPFIGTMMTGSADQNSALLTSTIVLENEPYKF